MSSSKVQADAGKLIVPPPTFAQVAASARIEGSKQVSASEVAVARTALRARGERALEALRCMGM
jgi:hypothetical protein